MGAVEGLELEDVAPGAHHVPALVARAGASARRGLVVRGLESLEGLDDQVIPHPHGVVQDTEDSFVVPDPQKIATGREGDHGAGLVGHPHAHAQLAPTAWIAPPGGQASDRCGQAQSIEEGAGFGSEGCEEPLFRPREVGVVGEDESEVREAFDGVEGWGGVSAICHGHFDSVWEVWLAHLIVKL